MLASAGPDPGLADDVLCGGAVLPAAHVGALAGFQFLVDVEEVADLVEQVAGHVAQVAQVRVPRVTGGHGQHLRVRAFLVGQPEHPDRAGGDRAAGEGRLAEQHHHVHRVAVLGQRAGDEPVVGRIAGRGEQHPVQPDPPADRVHLVLVPRPLRNLDDDVDLHAAPSRFPRPGRPPPGRLSRIATPRDAADSGSGLHLPASAGPRRAGGAGVPSTGSRLRGKENFMPNELTGRRIAFLTAAEASSRPS